MNNLCPRCGISFEREPGYFSGAMWVSSILAAPVMLLNLVALLLIFRSSLHPALLGALAAIGYIPFVPLTVRLSRSLWMYFDHQLNPYESGGNRGEDPPVDRVPELPTPPGGATRDSRQNDLIDTRTRHNTIAL